MSKESRMITVSFLDLVWAVQRAQALLLSCEKTHDLAETSTKRDALSYQMMRCREDLKKFYHLFYQKLTPAEKQALKGLQNNFTSLDDLEMLGE